eukprot:TRINITY_DN7074_c0_g1_i1.p1 TRINITY_DN7074_c0_g1~~TRINITY_DN7074_c0_g1_i1.p1  ORF type:complete len:151 (-),score=31.09 TRINITY_DN7074_c0_g1_i1:75-527(-)
MRLIYLTLLGLSLCLNATFAQDVTEDNSQDGTSDDLLRDQDPNIINPQNKQGYGPDIPLQVTETKPLKVAKKDNQKTIAEQTLQAVLQFGVLVAVAFMVGFLFMLNIWVELAYEKIKEGVASLCCSKRSLGSEIIEPDPAQLVGTFKRYK